jgi:hypothetical protein
MIQEGEGHWPNSSENLQKAIPRNFGPPTDDEPFRYEFAAPLGT